MPVKGKKQEAQNKISGVEIAPSQVSKDPTSGAWGNVSRNMSNEDLASPAIGRLLLDNLDQLKKENNELKTFRDEYYKKNTECAVLESKYTGDSKFQKLYTATQTLGGVVFGTSFTMMDNKPMFWILSISGGILIVFSIWLAYIASSKDKQ